ncbi:MAG: UDP-N-acetylmuramoyl-L-alanine--D-glutamate ligase [Kordiimonadaceae bacterium]|nr:UDP-N-acetylmuramoyl-L-alanine--D-glutamate ligase [Kordiimonadaceae bacterium]MBO6569146.1 UDP-N-acetylmuramoyl-L-alanine--D-glutamate ligase [Kordiimonadaceae bacterium]MBO6964622.1 UDP-N-acetylmuramoyl-L-alanine--D-glutamate ligase [Kordiimonadaceae bacterium]
MITVPAYQGKKVGVFGLARSGLATVHSLVASGAEVFAWDDNESARLQVESCAANLYELDLSQLDALVLAPGVPLTYPQPHRLVDSAKNAKVALISDLDIFEAARESLPDHKIIGITGTNGKSTTTALIGHILAECGIPTAVGGNIGTGVMALDALPAGGVYVFELSSFQLDLTKQLSCDIGVLLNMSPDHLDRHGDMATYVAAKRRLFDMQNPDCVAVVGVDDDICRNIADSLPFSIQVAGNHEVDAGVFVFNGEVKSVDEELQHHGSISDIKSLQGVHNWQNAAAAFAAVRAVGLESAEIITAMSTFPGLAHRQEIVSNVSDFLVVNDSKATNVDSAKRALETFDNIRWIAGGKAKDKDFTSLSRSLRSVRRAYLMGEHAQLLSDALPASLPQTSFATMAEAVNGALNDAEAGDTILLSPACTAFDQFDNFEQRGDAFKAAVAAYTGASS